MHGRGLIERIHGGASHPDNSSNRCGPLREVAFAEEKRRIGQAAAAHVADNSTVLITGGHHDRGDAPLPRCGARAHRAHEQPQGRQPAVEYSDIAIIVLGGLLRRHEMSLLGHLTIAGLDEFGIDQVFTGAFGIDPEIGVSGTNLYETSTDRSLISSARELIMLADH